MKIRKIFLDLVSFGTPQAIVFNLSSLLILLAALPTKLISTLPKICLFRNFVLPLIFMGNCPSEGFFAGCRCPACGLGNAMSRLLHGDFAGAWSTNKLVFVVIIVMLTLIAINIVKSTGHYKKTGKRYPK